jgi:hypothetical protein
MSPKKSVKKSFRETGVQARHASQDRCVQVEESVVVDKHPVGEARGKAVGR